MAPIRNKSKKNVHQHSALSMPLPQPSDWWQDFSKRFHESSSDLQSFESMFKMSTKTFDYITSLVKEDIMAKNSPFVDLNGNPLNLYDVVAIALRRLSSGDSLAVIGKSLNINQTTVAQISNQFVDALNAHVDHHLLWPSTETEMDKVKYKLEKIGGLPNCCGAIETTHILMSLPTADRNTNLWCDREKNQTMLLQAIADADMRFRDVTIGWPGSLTDEHVHKTSNMFNLCENGERLNGKRREFSEGNDIEEYIIGNSSLPLLPWLLTPYRGSTLCIAEVKFNDMLLNTHMVAQKALAKLKQNWKIIQGTMWRPDKKKLPWFILACCLLHNILIDMEDQVQEKLEFSDQHDVNYRPVICDSNDDHNGSVLRENVSLYLSKD